MSRPTRWAASGGTELAPAALRALGMPAAIDARDLEDLDVRIRGERRDPESGIVAAPDVLATTSTIRTAVSAAIERDEQPFLAGGCCSELPGALAGARDALGRVGLAYLDGHLDLYDGVTSPREKPRTCRWPWRWAWDRSPGSTCATVPRSRRPTPRSSAIGTSRKPLADGMVDPDTIAGLTHLDVDAITADGSGVGARVERALAAGSGRFWLHLDVDVLDEEVFPATDYLMPGGATWDELMAVMRPLAASPALVGLSLGCYNPEKDPDGACGRALVDAWRELLAPPPTP